MNTFNNKRRKLSQEKIEKIFIELIQTKEVREISVSDICKKANINRSTFYANYLDIYDLVDKIKEKMITDFFDIYKEEVEMKEHSYNFLKLFYDIKENQLFYKTYFKLEFDLSNLFNSNSEDEEMIKFFRTPKNKEYHIAFFRAGINAVIKLWLENGCVETPEEIFAIIKDEYFIDNNK